MKKKFLNYLITTLIGLVFTVAIILIKKVYAADSTKEVMHTLTDGFFASGILILCYGLLVVSTNGGTFDMLAYGMICFITLFKKDVNNRKYKDFYEYRKTKQESPRPFLFIIVVGAAYIAISMIFLAIYYQYK